MSNNIDINQVHEELNDIKNKLHKYIKLKKIGEAEEPSNKYINTDSNEFKKWFFNSLIVDKSGKPLVVYHGTDSNITSFKIEEPKTSEKKSTRSPGIFFSSDFKVAKTFGDKIYPVYLNLQNPLIIDAKKANWFRIGPHAKVMSIIAYLGLNPNIVLSLGQAEEKLGQSFDKLSESGKISINKLKYVAWIQGYDGAIFTNIIDTVPANSTELPNTLADTFIVFNSNQIKSIYETVGP